MGRKKANHEIECLHCGSTNLIKKGRDQKYDWQLFRCKDCGCYSNDKAIEVGNFLNDITLKCPDCSNEEFEVIYNRLTRFDIVCKHCNATHRYDWDDYVDDMNSESEQPKPERIVTTGRVVDYVDDSEPAIPPKCSCGRCNQEEKQSIPVYEKEIDLIDDTPVTETMSAKAIVRLAKSRQFNMDRNKDERKILRDQFRIDNTDEILNRELIRLLKSGVDLTVNNSTMKTIENESKEVMGIFQLSDLHFGEVIDSIYGNTFNFDVASKRLKLFVGRAKKIFKVAGVTNVTVALTGDILGAFEKIDKKLSHEHNRAFALLVGTYLLENVIIELAQDFLITVASVSGNESRIDDEYGSVNKIVTNNFDWIVHQILKMNFRGVKNVTVVDGRFDEKIITFFEGTTNPTYVLLTHGNNIKLSDYSKNIQNLIGRYSLQNLRVDYVLTGHYHNSAVSDNFCRSASLSSSNNYSNNSLNLYGRAAQNIHLIYADGNRDSMKIDLQNISDVIGYPLHGKLVEEMTTKSTRYEDMVIHIG